MIDRTKFKQYHELAYKQVRSVDKEELAERTRIIATNVTYYQMEFRA